MTTLLIAGGGTGGHLMPALAIAAAVHHASPDIRVVLAGAERGVEATILPTRLYPYTLLPVEPIYRRQWWRNARQPVSAWRAVAAARALLDRERPDAVVGTGGYASGPVVWSAARRGIPTAIQEQNAFPGLATRWLAGRGREIYLGVPEAAHRLKPGRHTAVVHTGNPITPPNRSPGFRAKARNRFLLTGALPVVVVTGGSQGSLAINRQVAAWIDGGGGHDVQLIWVAGKTTVEEFKRYHRPPFVQVFDFLDPMAEAWAVADLVVARAGMMTIAELCAWGIPSVLIPLPTAAADHQTANAVALAEAGAAVHLPQASLKRGVLGAEIERLVGDGVIRTKLAECALSRGKPEAAAEIAARIVALAGS
ncbi:MAG: glycosyltransferase [Gemmatimonadales bacterium]